MVRIELYKNRLGYSPIRSVEFGFGDMLSLAQTIGIVGTMVLTLYFSKRQIQSLSIDQQTRVLNDLDEKVRKMAEIIIEKPSMQKVIYKLEKPSEELAFVYYILWIVLMHFMTEKSP